MIFHLVIHSFIVVAAVCGIVIMLSLAWGFLQHALQKKEPLRLATGSHRWLRWLVAELQKELDKSGEET